MIYIRPHSSVWQETNQQQASYKLPPTKEASFDQNLILRHCDIVYLPDLKKKERERCGILFSPASHMVFLGCSLTSLVVFNH